MKSDVIKLKRMLIAPGGECASCPMSDNELYELLCESSGNINAAAYKACIRLSKNSSLSLADGTAAPDQSEYWRRLALLYRPNVSGCIGRSDNVL